MHRLLKKLESELPRECRERVSRAKDRYNKLIREQLVAETRFSLQGRLAFARVETNIPIRVVSGFPAPLQELGEKPDEDFVAELIGIQEMNVNNLGASALSIVDLVHQIGEDDKDFEASDPKYSDALKTVAELSKMLRQRAEQASLAKRMFAIQDDILGVYTPMPEHGGKVELYWSAIGVAAELLQVDIEDLTTVVLIHELAHGYTHLGKDADNRSWDDGLMFEKADRAVVEGMGYITRLASRHIFSVRVARCMGARF